MTQAPSKRVGDHSRSVSVPSQVHQVLGCRTVDAMLKWPCRLNQEEDRRRRNNYFQPIKIHCLCCTNSRFILIYWFSLLWFYDFLFCNSKGVDSVRDASGARVGSMSLGGGATQSLDDAVAGAVSAGTVMSVAAGNSNDDACRYSPAREPSVSIDTFIAAGVMSRRQVINKITKVSKIWKFWNLVTVFGI